MIPFQPKTTGMIPFTPGSAGKVNTHTPDLQTKLDTGNYGEKVGGQQLAGAKKIAGSISSGAKDIQAGAQSKNIFSGVGNVIKGVAEAGLGTITGASEIAFSPVTPAIQAIAKTVTPVLRQHNPQLAKLYDTLAPKVDALAKKHPDSATLFGDALNTALLAVGGGEAEAPLRKVAGETLTKEGLGAVKEDITGTIAKAGTKIADKLEGTTPAKLNDFIDKNYSKAIPSSSKKSVALTETAMANNREAMKLITDNKENLKFSNQAGTYDTGRLPENIVEHAQAVTQTRQQIWDKMSNMLKEKNVSISLDEPLKKIKAKIDSLGASASETPYLQALYDKYSKTPMATVDQMNTFIKDLNNDAEPFFKSGSDKAKATSSASVGNLFRDQLDTTAQQIGTPEVSLLRKQYGAMASTESDIAKALNKQLKGAGGGASGLADLFSGEEIARGIITGNPASIVSGTALQTTKWYLKWLHDPNRTLAKLYSTIDEVSAKGGVPRMESSFAPKERAGLPVVRGKLNTTETPKVINLPGKIGGFDEAQAKNIGLMESESTSATKPPEVFSGKIGSPEDTTPKSVKVSGGSGAIHYNDPNIPKERKSFNADYMTVNGGQKLSEIKNAPKGNWLNVGMNVGQTAEKLSEKEITSALPKDVKIISQKVIKGEEDHLELNLSRKLTNDEMTKYLHDTKQKSIPQFVSKGIEPYTPDEKLPVIKLRGKLKK
jgi:hypothetical protein